MNSWEIILICGVMCAVTVGVHYFMTRSLSAMREYDMLHSSQDAMIVVNKNQTIDLANAAAEDLFGWPANSMGGLPVEDLLPERFRERHAQHIEGFFAHPHPRPMGLQLDLWGRRSDGTEIPVEIGLAPWWRFGEEDLKVVAVIRAVSRR